MKFVKLAILVLVLAAVVYCAWLLLFPPAHRVAAGPQHTSLYADAGADTRNAIRAFRHGWSDSRFAEARNALTRHGSQLGSGGAALGDTLANGILMQLDSVICAAFRNDYPQRTIATVPEMAENYRGLDTLARYFPNIGRSPAFLRLMADRRAIDGAVEFGRRSFVLPPRVTVSLVRENGGYTLDWDFTLRDYRAYRTQQEARRGSLLNDYFSCPDLVNIAWVPRVLSQQAFNERIAGAESQYVAAERRVVMDFIEALPSDSRLSDADSRTAMADGPLAALEVNLPAPLADGRVLAAIHSAAAMLRTRQ